MQRISDLWRRRACYESRSSEVDVVVTDDDRAVGLKAWTFAAGRSLRQRSQKRQRFMYERSDVSMNAHLGPKRRFEAFRNIDNRQSSRDRIGIVAMNELMK